MKNKEKVIDYMMSFRSKPSYVVNRNIFDIRDEGSYLDIVMNGNYHIGIHYCDGYKMADFAYVEGNGAYGVQDLYYTADILSRRDKILKLWNLRNS